MFLSQHLGLQSLPCNGFALPKGTGAWREEGMVGQLLGCKEQLYCLHQVRAEALQGFKSRRGASSGPGPQQNRMNPPYSSALQ